MQRFWAFIDRFIPDNLLSGTHDVRRVARVTALLPLLLAVNGPPYAVLYWWLGLEAAALQIVLATVIVGGAVLTQWRLRSSQLASHQLIFGLAWILTAMAFPTGGHTSPNLIWMTLLPALAVALQSPRWGFIWAVLSASIVAAFGLAEQFGMPPEQLLKPEHEALFFIAATPTVMFLQFGLVMIFQGAKEQMAVELEAAHAEVKAAHKRARVVLDNVDQGLFLIDRAGRVSGEHSAALEAWFGAPEDRQLFWEWLESADPDAATWLAIGWDEVIEPFMPLEMVLDQLPKRLLLGQKTLSLSYQPLGTDPESFEQMLVVVTDITEQVAAERAEAAQREMVSVLEKINADRSGFLEFYDSAEQIVHGLPALSEPTAAFRSIHTLKGNASFFGLGTLVSVCHKIETALADERRGPTARELESVGGAWAETSVRLRALVGDRESVLIRKDEINAIIRDARRGCSSHELARLLQRWTWEPLSGRFQRIANQIEGLAERLDKGPVKVITRDQGIVLDPAVLAPFWSSFAHVVRNTIDPEEREAAGKGPSTLTLGAWLADSELVIRLSDDGGGIDWDKIREKALDAGIRIESHDDLIGALFSDGVSTAASVTDVSGRGVGMGALKAATEGLDGRIVVESTPGRGTTFLFCFPAHRVGLPPDSMLAA